MARTPLPPTLVSVQEAAEMMCYDDRTVLRMINKGELIAIHFHRRQRALTRADIELWVSKNRDAVEERRRQKVALRHIPLEMSADHERYLSFEARIHALEADFEAFKAEVRADLANLHDEIEADFDHTELHRTLHHIEVLLSASPDAEEEARQEGTISTHQPHTMNELKARISRSLSTMEKRVEKRHLPPGSRTISDFAQQHNVRPRTAVDHCKKLSITTRYQRQHARHLKNEWWIAPEHWSTLITYWETHGTFFKQCPRCPHRVPSNSLIMTDNVI